MISNKTCSICLEKICEEKDIIQLQCKHSFHEKCLTNYFKHIRKKSCPCPLCRVKFNKLNLKDKKPLKWVLRNRINIDLEYKNERIEILSRQFLSDPFKNYDKINDFQNEICNYLKHISNNYFLKKADKKHIFYHLKIITKYILMILLLFKTKKYIKKYKKKNKVIKSNFIYFLSKLESRKYVNQNIINNIYKVIK